MYPSYAPVIDPTAVMGRRFLAWIIDFMIGAIILFVMFVSFAEQRDFPTAAQAETFCDLQNEGDEFVCGPSGTTTFSVSYEDLGIMAIIGLGYWILNDAVLTGITGFSIGKGIVGLRVIRQESGQLVGFGRSLARWAMWVADWAPFCIPLVGLATANASNGHRRVGDIVARTFVVDKRQVGIPPQVVGVTSNSPAAPPSYPGGYPPVAGYPPSPGYQPAPSYPPAWGAPPSAPPSAPPWAAPQAPTPSYPSPQPAPPQWGPVETPGPVWAPPPSTPAPSPWPPSAPAPAPAPWAPPSADPTPSPAPTPSPTPGVDPTLVQPAYHEPPPTQQLPAVAASDAPSGPGVDAPLWDDARDAYIQWDKDINRWVQWDERTREWHPI